MLLNFRYKNKPNVAWFLIKHLSLFIQGANFPFVASNVETDAMKFHKSVVLDVDDHKIGIIGYLTTSTKKISRPGLLTICKLIKIYQNQISEI